ncbi:DUF1127 domain-containing protein [Roseivivax sp. CAU 1753]
MAHAQTQTDASRGGFFARLIDDIRDRRARRRIYVQTLTELQRLSDRELNDLGLGRSQLPNVAWQAAYER